MPEKEPDCFHLNLPELKRFGELHFGTMSGCLRWIGYDDNGVIAQFTDEGQRKFTALWDLYAQLGPTTFTPQDAENFHCLMMIMSGNERHLPKG